MVPGEEKAIEAQPAAEEEGWDWLDQQGLDASEEAQLEAGVRLASWRRPLRLGGDGEAGWSELSAIEGDLSRRFQESYEEVEAALSFDLRMLAHLKKRSLDLAETLCPKLELGVENRAQALQQIQALEGQILSEVASMRRQSSAYLDQERSSYAIDRWLSTQVELLTTVPLEIRAQSAQNQARSYPLRRVLSLILLEQRVYRLEQLFVESVQMREALEQGFEQERSYIREHMDKLREALEKGDAYSSPSQHQAALTRHFDLYIGQLLGQKAKVRLLRVELFEALAQSRVRLEESPGVKLMLLSLMAWLTFAFSRAVARHQAPALQRMRLRVFESPAIQDALNHMQRLSEENLGMLRLALDEDLKAHQALLSPFEAALEQSHERLVSSLEGLEEQPQQLQRMLKRLSKRQLKQIYRVFGRKVLLPLKRRYDEDPLQQELGRAEQAVKSLGPSCEGLSLEMSRPASRTRRLLSLLRLSGSRRSIFVPLPTIIRRRLLAQEMWVLGRFERELEEAREAFLAGMNELWNITRYNLDGAVAEVEEALIDDSLTGRWRPPRQLSSMEARELHTKSVAMAVEGLQRAMTRGRALVSERAAFHERVLKEYSRVLDITGGVRQDVGAAAHLQGRLSFLWSDLAQSASQLRYELNKSAKRLWRQLFASGQRLYAGLAARSRSLRDALGISTPEAAKHAPPPSVAIAERLVRQWDHLPPVYRRLFALDPLELDEFLAGREESQADVAEAIERWQRGESSAILVHGNPGSGKRSLLNTLMERQLQKLPITHLEMTGRLSAKEDLVSLFSSFEQVSGAHTIDEVEAALKQIEPQVFILQEAERLFIRRVGGFAALRRFLLLISRLTPRHMWLVFISSHSHDLLQRIWRIGDAFTHVLSTSEVEEEVLRKAITLRHEPSGFKLHFDLSPALEQRLGRELRQVQGDEKATQELLARRYFEQLHNITGGNLFVALFYWLRSVHRLEERTLHIAPLREIDLPVLGRLTTDQRFALTAILQHGSLTVEQLSEIFNWESLKARLMMQFFLQNYLVLPDAAEENEALTNRINPIFLKPLVSILQRHHIVY